METAATDSFLNRTDAAVRLLAELDFLKGEDGLVLAVPRGGVPLGRIIADGLGWPLVPLLIKKIGHPANPEFAIGAVTLEGAFTEDHPADVDPEFLKEEILRLRKLLSDRQRQLLHGREPENCRGRTVLLVDDGAATGKTLLAGIQLLRAQLPLKIIVAVPVASADAATRLRSAADRLVCLLTPEDFFGVGQFYQEFPQVEDEEVERLLDTRKVK